jgi:hypothetical protein
MGDGQQSTFIHVYWGHAAYPDVEILGKTIMSSKKSESGSRFLSWAQLH